MTAENFWNWLLACSERSRDRNLLTAWDLDSPRGFAWGFFGNGTVKLPFLARVWFSLKCCTTRSSGERLRLWDSPKLAKKLVTRGNGNIKDAILWWEDARVLEVLPARIHPNLVSKATGEPGVHSAGRATVYQHKCPLPEGCLFFQDAQNQDQLAVKWRGVSTLNWNELAGGASHK